MSNNTITPVLNQTVGVLLNPNDARFMILNAFRYTLAHRDWIEQSVMIEFLCNRAAELDSETKATIIKEINSELQRDSEFTNADIECWLIVSKKLSDSLNKSNFN